MHVFFRTQNQKTAVVINDQSPSDSVYISRGAKHSLTSATTSRWNMPAAALVNIMSFVNQSPKTPFR